jgi:hypothetical protein
VTVRNPVEHLKKLIFFCSKAAEVVNGEAIVYAIQLLVYVNANMAFFKGNETYPLTEEFNMLANALERLEPHTMDDENTEFDVFIKNIKVNLISNLIMVHDLILERSLEKINFTKITKVMNLFSDSLLNEVKNPPASQTAKYLTSQGKSLSLLLTAPLDQERIRALFARSSRLTRDYKDNDIYTLCSINDSTTDQELEKAFRIGLDFYLKEQLLGLESEQYGDIPNLISVLATNYTDKERFVTLFLRTYAQWYEHQNPKAAEVNMMLKGVIEFLPMLDALLQPNRLPFLIEQHIQNNQVFMRNKYALEHAKFLLIYQAGMSFYIIPQSIDDKVHESLSWRFYVNLLSEGNRYLFPHLQVAGRNAQDSFKLIPSDSVLHYLPPIMQTELVDLFSIKPDLKSEVEAFIILFETVNSSAAPHQQRNRGFFFTQNHDAVMQIAKIMGTDGVRYLKSHLAVTVLNLERTLSSIPTLPSQFEESLREYYRQCTKSKQSIKDVKAFITIMIILDLLIAMDADFIEKYFNIPQKNSPQQYQLDLARILLDKVFQGIQVNLSKEQITAIFDKITPEKLVKLIAATKKMSDNEYQAVYLNLLKLDLTGGDVDDFLHNKGQDNEIGKRLAYHNDAIRTKLLAKQITPQAALNYKKTLDFSVSLKTNVVLASQDEQYKILLTFLNQLSEEIGKMRCEPFTDLKKLGVFLNKVKSTYSKSLEIDKTIKDYVGEINVILTTLTEKEYFFSDSFNEFSQHAREQYKVIKGAQTQSKEKNTYHFQVEQWNKNKIDTFFLGDEVGCCLATTNAQFHAMVQRRMDDAMLFHVAVDQDTGRAAALIWLYLAETADNKIVLMANFFEVHSKYAANETLRIALLNGLLQFTHQYGQDNPNISDFYMNKLNYGWNIRDLDQYPKQELILIDKLGGPFIPQMGLELGSQWAQDPEMIELVRAHTQEKYYLVSLSQNEFHRFDPAFLNLEQVTVNSYLKSNKHQNISFFKVKDRFITKVPKEEVPDEKPNNNK